jgi:hypothetical protein
MRWLALLRGLLAAAGILLLGGALVWAPVAAFQGADMLLVTKAGIAGVVLALVAKLIPLRRVATEEDAAEPSGEPPRRHD